MLRRMGALEFSKYIASPGTKQQSTYELIFSTFWQDMPFISPVSVITDYEKANLESLSTFSQTIMS